MDGGSTDGTRDVVRGYVAKDNRIRLLENPHRTVPYALNIGIRASRGDTIVRVDAHSTYPDDYVLRLVNELYRLKADNVVGRMEYFAWGYHGAGVCSGLCDE